MGQFPITSGGYQPTPSSGSLSQPSLVTETLSDFKRCLITQHVITGPCQLVRHRLDRDHWVGLGLLALIKAPDDGIVPNSKVGGFDKGPGQRGIAILAIACP